MDGCRSLELELELAPETGSGFDHSSCLLGKRKMAESGVANFSSTTLLTI